ncbi:coniferyl aldehyde dehydrogenase [Rhodanobacter sp. K2T2]|uniref:coniferyl aldehyde dehydrogenase n=1 Tax=Rhodanobacter sp. K2T2 TaxID=2723085 RepID=UPI0015C8B62A|nr:coniferyl aldehyde dehydrogenase [Rhodanobacter sp. K2T2]
MNLRADTDALALDQTFQSLRRAWMAHRPSHEQRRVDLNRLRSALKARLESMAQAVSADFGHRSRHETLLGEGMTVLAEIDHMLAHLGRWMRPQRRSVGWRLWPARAQVRYVALGVVGVIAPWNYPISLALIPLATAIAAGNHVFLKPSEHTPHASDFLRELLTAVFPADRVALALGGAEVGNAFAKLPFDHLLFTGSTAVGRKVMLAAAANLTPVTLELGGKSPVIVGRDVDVSRAASRLVTGKFYNAGQTCVAPDYVLVHESRRDDLLEAIADEVAKRYRVIDDNVDYTRVINAGQFERLCGYLADARQRGLTVRTLVEPCDSDRAARDRVLPPTLVLDPDDDALIMREEIFGPILAIKTYRDIEQAIDYINRHDRPLALYIFSRDKAEIERVLENIVAGGVSVNETLLHNVVSDLPFGGVGASGIGHYHGLEGFKTFSKAMPVLTQAAWPISDRIKPPYGKLADFVVKALVR